MKQSRFLIYGLIDPRNGELRYIGKSVCGLKRPKTTYSRAINGHEGNTHKVKWIKSLYNEGLRYEIEILESLESADCLIEAEIFWIAYFKSLGCNLTNLTSGGDGLAGMPVSIQTRIKRGQSRNGLTATDRQKIADLYDQGLSTHKLAKDFCIAPSVVFSILKMFNVKFRSKSEAHGNKNPEFLYPIIVDLYSTGLTSQQVADSIGLSKFFVLSVLRKHKVKLRSRWSSKVESNAS